MGKYYLNGIRTNTNVSWTVLDKNGNEIDGMKNHYCFAPLSQKCIPEGAVKIIFYKNKKEIPYSVATMKKWLKVITELGFPCSFELDKNNRSICRFIFDLTKYKYRPQALSGFSLARDLTETYICRIPDRFFTALDENPKQDKFLLLQKCHRKNSSSGYGGNTNHMVTYAGNGRSTTLKKVFEKFANNRHKNMYSVGFCSIDSNWKG